MELKIMIDNDKWADWWLVINDRVDVDDANKKWQWWNCVPNNGDDENWMAMLMYDWRCWQGLTMMEMLGLTG